MKVPGFVVVLMSMIFLAFTAPALALDPGDSALNQYVEQIPGIKGDEQPKPPSGEKPGDVIGDEPARELSRLGTDGAATAAMAASTAPDQTLVSSSGSGTEGESDGGNSGGSISAPVKSDTGGSLPVGTAAEGAFGVSGGDGFGWSLLILVSVIAVVSGMLFYRHSQRSSGSD